MRKFIKILIGISILAVGIIMGIIGMVAYVISIDYDPKGSGMLWEDMP